MHLGAVVFLPDLTKWVPDVEAAPPMYAIIQSCKVSKEPFKRKAHLQGMLSTDIRLCFVDGYADAKETWFAPDTFELKEEMIPESNNSSIPCTYALSSLSNRVIKGSVRSVIHIPGASTSDVPASWGKLIRPNDFVQVIDLSNLHRFATQLCYDYLDKVLTGKRQKKDRTKKDRKKGRKSE